MEIIYSAVGLAWFIGWIAIICFCFWGAITMWKEWVPTSFKSALYSFIAGFIIWFLILFLIGFFISGKDLFRVSSETPLTKASLRNASNQALNDGPCGIRSS